MTEREGKRGGEGGYGTAGHQSHPLSSAEEKGLSALRLCALFRFCQGPVMIVFVFNMVNKSGDGWMAFGTFCLDMSKTLGISYVCWLVCFRFLPLRINHNKDTNGRKRQFGVVARLLYFAATTEHTVQAIVGYVLHGVY